MFARAMFQNIGDFGNLLLDFIAIVTVHHGEKIVRPGRRPPRTMVAMRNEVERTDDLAGRTLSSAIDFSVGE